MEIKWRQSLVALLAAACLSLACLAAGSVRDILQPTASLPATAGVTLTREPGILLTITPIPTRTVLPSVTLTPGPSPSPTPAIPDIPEAACVPVDTQRQIGWVTRVIDGDTIEVEIEGELFPLRYIGIDTPELNVPGDLSGEQARIENEATVLRKTVLLVKDVSETDRFERLLRYVIVDGAFVNYQLVRMGIAEAIRYAPDDACHVTFLEAQAAAQAEGSGRWGTITPIAPPGDDACDPAYPDVCIPPPPPDLECADIPYRRFRVLPPDPHNFDGDGNGFGCEQ